MLPRGLLPAVLFTTFAIFSNVGLAVPTLYTCGDSTVMSWSSTRYPKTGWGQVLPKFIDSTKAAVVNKAVSGTSAKSFYDTYWSGVKSLLKPGDYAFFQFGINDASADSSLHTDPFTTFEDYLRKFITETQSKGAFPVIVSTVPGNAWNSDGAAQIHYGNYPAAARDVAAATNVPCIDLDGMGRALMNTLGQTYCTYYWYMNLSAGDWPNYGSGQSDNTHFQEDGAIEMARLVTQGIRSSSYSSLQALVPAIRPLVTVTFTRNNSNGIVTRTQDFPQGVTVTAYARANSGFSFLNWTGSLASSNKIAQFTMGTATQFITGNFSGGSSSTYQAENGTLGGGAVVESVNAGFVGSGYVNFSTTGGTLTFSNVTGNGGGTKSLAIRYANGTTASRTGTITVNGATSNITFNPTGAWTTWATLNVNITLTNSTTNTIKFASTGQDLANIDQITVP